MSPETTHVFVRDATHWLFKLSPDQWISAGLSDLERAEAAYAANNARAGLVGAKRAAGMALNGALIVEPDERWGRTYVEHIAALAKDDAQPARLAAACKTLLETAAPGPAKLVTLRTSTDNRRVLDAARDVIAHAYAVVKRHERKGQA